jgi:hypothetical protein
MSLLDKLSPRLLKVKRGQGYNQSPTFADGSVITGRTVQKLSEFLAGIAVPVQWQPGDLVILDNHRFMHGRNRMVSGRRKVVIRLGDLKMPA